MNVAGSFASTAFTSADWDAVASACDVVEFRLDAFPSAVPEVREAVEKNPRPSLLTVRDPREGGLNNLGRTPRHALMLNLVDEFDFLDLEIANLAIFQDVVEQAHDADKIIIGSFHDFQAMPPVSRLEEYVAEAKTDGADVVKLAVTISTVEELATLAGLLAKFPDTPLALMGMGRFGPVSRLLFGQLGSVLNYGYLDDATVPGQWSAAELQRLLAHVRSAEPAAAILPEESPIPDLANPDSDLGTPPSA